MARKEKVVSERAVQNKKDKTGTKRKIPPSMYVSDKRLTIHLRVCLLAVLAIFLLFFLFAVKLSAVPSRSMEPTIKTGDIVISTRNTANIQRGDIVIFHSKELKKTLVKRVIGVGGDEIKICEDGIYLNGELLEESYLPDGINTEARGKEIFNVPEDCYLLFGDNREHSADARYWENPYIDASDVKAVAVFHIGTKGGFHFGFLYK